MLRDVVDISYSRSGQARNRSSLAIAPNSQSAEESPQSEFMPVPQGSGIHSWRYRFLKPSIDLACASVMLAVSLVPGLLISAAILLNTGGPVFYREERVGRGGRTFRIWKFRSMEKDCVRWVKMQTISNNEMVLKLRIEKDVADSRITSIGCFLRRWSLDELPQVLNVICGHMSLVGPRPVVQGEIPLYRELRDFYLAATPGISGLWQVSGRSNLTFPVRAELDASYVSNWSLWNDLKILARTVPAVLKRVGAR